MAIYDCCSTDSRLDTLIKKQNKQKETKKHACEDVIMLTPVDE